MVYQNEKIRTPILGAYELFICPNNLSHPFPYHAVYCHQEIRLWPPSVTEFMHNHHVYGTGPTGYFCTFSHVTYTFKCTGKPLSRYDNDELEGAFVKQPYVLHSIKFQNVCLCMSMYMWELFTRVYSRTLHSP